MKKRKIRVISTLGDLGTLLMSLIYITYISLLLIMDIGVFWLNITILILTGLYFLFFIFKIFYLNSKKIARPAKFIFKYAKFFVRLINATIVIVSLVNLQMEDGSEVFKIISIAILIIMLTVSLAWDIGIIFIKRKLREMRDEWENLPSCQKHDKLEYLIKSIATAIDGSGDLAKFLFERDNKKIENTDKL